MAQAATGLHDDEIEPERIPREGGTRGKHPAPHELECRGPETGVLPPIDRLLGQPEVAP